MQDVLFAGLTKICGSLNSRCRAEQTWTWCTLETDFPPVLRKGLKLHLFNELPWCLCCGGVTRLFQSLSWFAKRRRTQYWLVSSRMKTNVVLPACHNSPNQLTSEDTQTDLLWGWDTLPFTLQIRPYKRTPSPEEHRTLFYLILTMVLVEKTTNRQPNMRWHHCLYDWKK